MKRRHLILAAAVILSSFAGLTSAAPRVDPELAARLPVAQPTTQFGVILTFQGDRVTAAQVDAIRAVGVTTGVRMVNFPIIGVNATAAQIRQMMSWPELRSVYLNSPLQLNLNQSRPLIGVNRLRADIALTTRNGGVPVSGRGVAIAINDSGIDGSHQDLAFNPLGANAKTVQNVLVTPNDKDGLVVRLDALGNPLEGILPPAYVENVIDTDTHVGHGTHCAGIAAGTGQASGGLYQGVAPGAKLVGLGSGGVLFVLGQVAAFDYIYTHQFDYNIRVVSNSWGNSAVAVDAEHPVNVASKKLHDERNVVVVFANGNDGPRPNSQNRWASVPWIITAGASTKDGRIAGFSSRGIFGDPVVHPTVLTPGTGGPTGQGYTSAIVSTRAKTNAVSTGLNDDAEIPPAFLPNYTQISGTSMACPHLAGVVANILEANPSLSADEVKTILEQTATPLATYDLFEAGAGLANVHAAVDLAFNRAKPYGSFGFAEKGLTLQQQDGGSFQGTVEANGSVNHTFTVPANTRFTFVQLDWGGAVGEDAVVVDNTEIVMNDLALTVNGNGINQTSDALNLAALFGAREALKIEFPPAGAYTASVSAGIQPVDQPYRLVVTHYTYDPGQVSDLAALDAAARTKALRLVYDRVMSADNGLFRAYDPLTRMEMGRAVMFGARVMQYLPQQASFSDVTPGTPDALVAESLRREGVMGVDGAAFGPGVSVSRLEQAVALVRALRLDAQARARANTNVTVNGQTLVDNAQIPGPLRGYVQIAIDRGVMQAFPAELREIAPGQFQAIPGPRFEPARIVKRAEFLDPMLKVISILFGE
ncbi:MAG TPA: S8 family serine peptidase [Blastocatellia bacterium]|jgi:serine protease AprX|nr:S8 family serine peptidase [Blastocatellia bacterium]